MKNPGSEVRNLRENLISRMEQKEDNDREAVLGHCNKSQDNWARTYEWHFQSTWDTLGRPNLSLMDKGGEECHSEGIEYKKITKI